MNDKAPATTSSFIAHRSWFILFYLCVFDS